jgi:ribonuclease BN (tRNA processing enzyme)
MDGPIEIEGLTVTPFDVNHPQGAFGFRVGGPNRSVAIVTDHEAGTSLDAEILISISGSDVLIHDAQYLPVEVDAHAGWGHSTYVDAAGAAEAAGVNELILTSHNPDRTDVAIDEMVDATRELFRNTEAARPGMEIPL